MDAEYGGGLYQLKPSLLLRDKDNLEMLSERNRILNRFRIDLKLNRFTLM